MDRASRSQALVEHDLEPEIEAGATEEGPALRDVIESGDFRIDLGTGAVTVRGERLELCAEEFEVLVFLVNHPQRLITPHTQLATHWAPSPPRQTDFLRVLLSLRKKLEAFQPGKQYLRTEPWVIYRFNPMPLSATE